MRNGRTATGRRGGRVWACACGVLLVLLLLCGCGEQDAPEVSVTFPPLPTPTLTPTPQPTPTPTPTPTPAPRGLLDYSHEDRFLFDSVLDTDSEYRDENIAITLKKVEENPSPRTGEPLVYFVVDIYLQDVTSLHRGYAMGLFRHGRGADFPVLAADCNAIVAITGDYCTMDKQGLVIADGVVEGDTGKYNRELCVLFADGTMKNYAHDRIDADAIIAADPWQSWNFGPILLDEGGLPKTEFHLVESVYKRNPRAVIGYYEPGHYCFVLVEGRRPNYSTGLDLAELSQLMYDLGCTSAYNLDGGLTAQLAWHNVRINNPYSIRRIRDITYIAYPDAPTP